MESELSPLRVWLYVNVAWVASGIWVPATLFFLALMFVGVPVLIPPMFLFAAFQVWLFFFIKGFFRGCDVGYFLLLVGIPTVLSIIGGVIFLFTGGDMESAIKLLEMLDAKPVAEVPPNVTIIKVD